MKSAKNFKPNNSILSSNNLFQQLTLYKCAQIKPVISPFCTVKGMTRLKGRSMGSMPLMAVTGSSVAWNRTRFV